MEALFSPYWYRVALLMPRLRSHARVHRHQYRDQTWYLLEDCSNERFHRFSPAAYALIGLMDGRRTVQEIWELASGRLGDDAPTQPDVVRLLIQLHAADLLQCDIPPDTVELLDRHHRGRRRQWRHRWGNILAWRFPLLDPNRFLQALLPLVRPFFTPFGALLWILGVLPAMVIIATRWPEITADLIDRIAVPQTFILLLILFPIIKALHELGHAFAVKVLGGEVHEMGVMLLVCAPVPYVDAGAASAFQSKWHRALVGAAGMIVELWLAAIALYVWISAEPGTVRTVAYHTILVAGLSTLIFNGNPLLRFDGYYILADLIEIPNLSQRATKYLGYLCERYLFGRRDAPCDAAAPGERLWFAGYAVSSFLYRALVLAVVVLFVMDHVFALAVLLAAFAGFTWVALPVGKGLHYVFAGPALRPVRSRAIAVSLAMATVVFVALCVAPVPFRTKAEGVVWIPDEALVRMRTDGFIAQVVAQPGARVRRGDVLLICRNAEVAADVTVLEWQLKEIRARIRQHLPEDLVKMKMWEEEERYIKARLAQAYEHQAELTIHSSADGTFVLPRAADLPGRFVKRGELLAQVVDLDRVRVRAVVDQTDIDLIRRASGQVDVRFAERLARTVQADVTRVVPSATDELPSPALSGEGGGQVPSDPKDASGQKAMKRMFHVELEASVSRTVLNVGGRAYLRFHHGWQPLAMQWYRQARQLFLSRFHV